MFQSFLALISAFVLLVLSSVASAQPVALPPLIRIVVPFSPGASTDILARKMAIQLAGALGTSVVVENRVGGSSLIGASAVAHGPRDGSMLLLTTTSTVGAAATARLPAFDLNGDLAPIAMLGEGPMMMAASVKSGIRSPADLVAAARANPDAVTYGTSGIGSLPHLSSERFADAAGVRLRHIPYKGGAQALIDLAAGTIDTMLGTYLTFEAQIKSGRAHLIGVTSRQPSPAFPHVPPLALAAPGYEDGVWVIVFAQAATPAPLAQLLNREINRIAMSKEIRDLLLVDDKAPTALSLEALRTRVRGDFASMKRLATEKKIAVD